MIPNLTQLRLLLSNQLTMQGYIAIGLNLLLPLLVYSQSNNESGNRATLSTGWAITGRSNIQIGPDANDALDILKLLLDKQIQLELAMTDGQISAVEEFNKGWRDYANGVDVSLRTPDADRLGALTAIDEILTGKQKTRVRQLAYRIEIGFRGLGSSLCDGRLSEEVGVYENQKSSLRERSRVLDAEFDAAIIKLSADAEDAIISLLLPEQQERLRKNMGPYHHYEDQSAERSLFDQLIRKQEEENKEEKK